MEIPAKSTGRGLSEVTWPVGFRDCEHKSNHLCLTRVVVRRRQPGGLKTRPELSGLGDAGLSDKLTQG
jgi:hypothetical protein